MKVEVFNKEGNFIQLLNNVVEIKKCIDKRILVTYIKTCECCGLDSRFILQVPSDYDIKIRLQESDNIKINE
ncbi:hypothetical protein DSECCO2_607930 [anaerobic digester metagenome]